jgi:hypothetical protein
MMGGWSGITMNMLGNVLELDEGWKGSQSTAARFEDWTGKVNCPRNCIPPHVKIQASPAPNAKNQQINGTKYANNVLLLHPSALSPKAANHQIPIYCLVFDE